MFPRHIRHQIRKAIWGDISPNTKVAQRAKFFAIFTFVILNGLLVGGLMSQFHFGLNISEFIIIAVIVLLTIFLFGQILYLRSQRK